MTSDFMRRQEISEFIKNYMREMQYSLQEQDHCVI